MTKNKPYYVSYEKEISDVISLSALIRQDEWIDRDTFLVICSPDYSSIAGQILNHKLSRVTDNELLEELTLEMPYPTMSQVLNKDTLDYQLYDPYLMEWVNKYIRHPYKYLFVECAVIRGKNFSKIKSAIKGRINPDNYKFASTYLEKSSIFKPNYFAQEYEGDILFQWENMDNPNWNY